MSEIFSHGNFLPTCCERIIGDVANGFLREVIMNSPVVKRSVVIDGHKTSVSLEEPFWNDLKELAYVQRMTVSKMIGQIDKGRQHSNLSSALRLFVLDQVRTHGDPWQYSRVRKASPSSDDTPAHTTLAQT